MFFKKSGSKPPALTPRQRLVGDMQQAYPSVRAADAQGSAYEMALRPGGVPMTLRIVLDAAFPATKPGRSYTIPSLYIATVVAFGLLLIYMRIVCTSFYFYVTNNVDIQVYASVPISHPQIDPRTKQIINMPKVRTLILQYFLFLCRIVAYIFISSYSILL